MTTDPEKVICSMIRVSKHYNQRPVLQDISLSYFYGAKIGVLGLNGAGKSSLLRILAGIDQAFNGELILSKGYTVGFLEQEPELDEASTVRAIVAEGAQATVDLLDEFNAINEKFSEPMSDDEMTALPQSSLERTEKLEQLRAIENGFGILVGKVERTCDGIDTPEQYAQFVERYKTSATQKDEKKKN